MEMTRRSVAMRPHSCERTRATAGRAGRRDREQHAARTAVRWCSSSCPTGRGPRPAKNRGRFLRSTSPEYFRALGIPVTAGRGFAAGDTGGAPRVAIVNETLASRPVSWRESRSAVSSSSFPGARAPWTRHPGRLTIVGVAANVKEVGFNEVEFNDIYVPFAQMAAPAFELVARTGVPAATGHPGAACGGGGDRSRLPVSSVSTLEQRVDEALQGGPVQPADGLDLRRAPRCCWRRSGSSAPWRMRCRNARASSACVSRSARSAAPSSAPRSVSRCASPASAGWRASAATLVLARVIGNALYLVPGEHNGLLYGVTTTDPIAMAAAIDRADRRRHAGRRRPGARKPRASIRSSRCGQE